MSFDYKAARDAGASDEEILKHLTATRHFDVQGALNEGAKTEEIIQHLSTTSAPAWSGANKPSSNFIDSAKSMLKTAKYVIGGAVGGPVGLAATYASDNPRILAEPIKNIAKAGVQLTVQNPAVAEIAGAFGGQKARSAVMQPRDIPLLGEVKPLSARPDDVMNNRAQSSAEDAVQAANIYLEAGAPGSGKVLSRVGEAFREGVGPFSKWGQALANVPARTLERAATPEVAKRVQAIRDVGGLENPEDIVNIGESAFMKAKALRTKAMKAYGKTRDLIVAKNKGQIIQRSREFVDGVTDVLKTNKIGIGPEGVDTVGSAFEGSSSAKTYLDRAYGIMTRPIVAGGEAVDDLLTRREAITGILDEVPFAEKNLRRVLGGMRTSFDTTLENMLGKSATALRSRFAKSVSAADPIIKSMITVTNGKAAFSENKALAFMRKAATEAGFDQRKLLSELDNVVGSDFAQTAEAIGIQKAIDRLDPIVSSRVFDIVKSFIIKGSLGTLAPLFSPRTWGTIATRKGLKIAETATMSKSAIEAAKKANEFRAFFLKNLLTLPIREGLSEATNNNSSTPDE